MLIYYNCLVGPITNADLQNPGIVASVLFGANSTVVMSSHNCKPYWLHALQP